jgi:hypothetical protein
VGSLAGCFDKQLMIGVIYLQFWVQPKVEQKFMAQLSILKTQYHFGK